MRLKHRVDALLASYNELDKRLKSVEVSLNGGFSAAWDLHYAPGLLNRVNALEERLAYKEAPKCPRCKQVLPEAQRKEAKAGCVE